MFRTFILCLISAIIMAILSVAVSLPIFLTIAKVMLVVSGFSLIIGLFQIFFPE